MSQEDKIFGIKHDQNKDPWQLVPWDAVRGITKVLDFGSKKYGSRNWEKGMQWDKLFRAAIEHLQEWFQTGKPDEETGLSHLYHAGCCILFLIAYELRGVGQDNRPCAKNQFLTETKQNRPKMTSDMTKISVNDEFTYINPEKPYFPRITQGENR